MCAIPEKVTAHITARAERLKRPVGAIDLICGLPLADEVFSPTTPDVYRVKEAYLHRLGPALRIFEQTLPSLSKIKREKRIVYWNGEGKTIRSSHYLLHLLVPIEAKRADCFTCQIHRELDDVDEDLDLPRLIGLSVDSNRCRRAFW